MARLTFVQPDPTMTALPIMCSLTVQLPRRLRPLAATPRRRLRALAAGAALVVIAGLLAMGAVRPPAAAAASQVASVPANAVVVAPHDFADGDALIAALCADGAHPAIVYLPRATLARVSPAAAARLRSQGFTVLRAHATPSAGVASESAAALGALNSLADGTAAAAAGGRTIVPAGLPSLGADLKLPNAEGAAGATQAAGLEAPAFTGRLATLPSATEPAAFAAGSVAVSIIFPQSAATQAGETSESWATDSGGYGQPDPEYPKLTDREAYIVGKVSTTLAWWASRNPAADLTFVIPAEGKAGAPRQVAFKGATVNGATVDEPIDVSSQDDQAWRHPLMKSLGFSKNTTDDTPPPETAYDNAVRRANGTDWAFTVYCVDSLKTSSGAFPDGAFAYTFDLFGPYTVTTWSNGSYGPDLYDGVLAHEIGHVFGALDEYAPSAAGYPSTGDLYSGYLWVRNANAVQGGTTNDACIMRGGNEGIQAYQGGTPTGEVATDGICPSTAGQIGWRATRNGIPDVIDTAPTVTLRQPIVVGSTATVAGVVSENPWPPGHNAQGHAFVGGISIFVPHNEGYSVDGGAWSPFGTSGAGASQSFTFTTAALQPVAGSPAPTRHVISVAATTGTAAASSIVAWVGQTPVTLTLSRGAATIPLGAKVKLIVRAADGGFPIGLLPGIAIGPLGGAPVTVATGAGGRAAATFAPRFTTQFQASFKPGAQSAQFEPASSGLVAVAVRALLTAHAGRPSAKHVVRVSGAFKPVRGGVRLILQLRRGHTWKTVARTRTTARSTYKLTYTAHKGTVRLRVRFAGDARNAAALKALPALVVS
jgi:hypothetical protein